MLADVAGVDVSTHVLPHLGEVEDTLDQRLGAVDAPVPRHDGVVVGGNDFLDAISGD